MAAAFLAAWGRDDYVGMYSLLAPTSQRVLTIDDFAARYRQIATKGTIRAVHAELRSVLESGKRATGVYDVRYDLRFLEPFTKTSLTIPLTFARDRTAERWGVVWSDSLILPGLEPKGSLAVVSSWSGRANIKDRTGERTLAGSASQGATTVGVVPNQIQDETALLAALSPILNQSPEDLKAKYANAQPDWFVPLGVLSGEATQANIEVLQNLPGVSLKASYFPRSYSYGSVASHVLGWLGPIPAAQLPDYKAKGYGGDEMVGLSGVEAWGEPYLAGTPGGRLVLLTARGAVSETLSERKPEPGQNVLLSLDFDLQQAAQNALADKAGAIVAMDVHTGQILALASNPSFDPNIFEPTNPASAKRETVLNDPARPLLDRATQGTYPLGSVFKIVTMAAALEQGGYTPDTTYTCNGVFTRLGRVMTDWKPGGHGTITLRQGLIGSCDPYFFDIGLNLYGKDPNILPSFGRGFGFGQSTGIQQLAEEAGIMPDPAWKIQAIGEQWYPGDSVNMATGQGYVTVTPLQVVRMISTIANGGTLYRPSVVFGLADTNGQITRKFDPEPMGNLPVSAQNLQVIRDAMHGVTSDPKLGTATFVFKTLPISVAGKTGTAENSGDPHAWFAGYAPADSPQIAIVVLVEHGGEGATMAAPIFRKLVETYFKIPSPTPTPTPAPG